MIEEADPVLVEQVKATILDLLVKRGGGVSFAEVDQALTQEGIAFKGKFHVSPGALGDNNLALWFGWSASAVHALADLADAEVVEAAPTDPRVYICDGRLPNCPIVDDWTRYPSEPNDEPRWWPMVLERGPEFDRATTARHEEEEETDE